MDALGGDVTHIKSGDIYTCTPSVIDWIIVGGESGARARPMDLAWARSLVEQGRAAGVPVFVKQLGRRPEDEGRRLLIRDAHGGVIYEWPDELRVREFPGEQAALPADKGEVT